MAILWMHNRRRISCVDEEGFMTFSAKEPMWSPNKDVIIIGILLENKTEYLSFVASPNDCETIGREIYQRAVDGEFGEVEAYHDRTKYVVFRKDNLLHLKCFDCFSNIAIHFEEDVPYWIVTPEAYNAIKDYPIETWEITGEPDGYGWKPADKEETDAANEHNGEPGQITGDESVGCESETGPDTAGDGGSGERPLVGDDDGGTEGSVEDLPAGAS
jgi:hypothetical protein